MLAFQQYTRADRIEAMGEALTVTLSKPAHKEVSRKEL